MDRIVADLEEAREVKDIILWLQDKYGTMRPDEAFALLERLISQRPDATFPREERKEYAFNGLSVDAAPWTWRVGSGN